MLQNNHIPLGIHTKKNQCFLSSILQALTYTMLPIENFYSSNQFGQNLLDTLSYIRNSHEISNLDLFWETLRSKKIEMFSQNEEDQNPQDGLEALLNLLELSCMDKYMQIQFEDGDSCTFLLLRKRTKPFYIVKGKDEDVNKKYFTTQYMTVSDIVQQLTLPDQKVVVYVANFNEFKLVVDYSQTFNDIMLQIKPKNQQIYLKLQSDTQDEELTIWIRLNYQEHDIWRPFCHLQPFNIIINATVQEVYVMIASLLNCYVSELEIVQNKIHTLDKNQLTCFIESVDNLDDFFDIYVQTDHLSRERLDKFNSYSMETNIVCTKTQLFMEMLHEELLQYDSDVVILPEVLVIVIARVYLDDNHQIKRRNKLIEYPTFLNLSSQSQQKVDYKLCSVVNHVGGINDGHYYSYVERDNKWYCVDNHQTYPLYNHISREANILFYRQEKRQ